MTTNTAADARAMVDRLRAQAFRSSTIQQEMAEGKSRRNSDGKRDDLYSWPTPEQTTEGEAAALIEQLLAAAEQQRTPDSNLQKTQSAPTVSKNATVAALPAEALDALKRALALIPIAPDGVEEVERLRSHISEQTKHVENRIQDGHEMGAVVWRIALEDVASENRAALSGIHGDTGK